MTPSQKITESIKEALRRNTSDATALAALAADYSEQCRKVNTRLEQIREILDRGDDRQALLLGETEPPVMDEADALCFPGAPQWRELCASHQLTSGPEIKATVIQRLNLIYSKGITASHAIYKEFRTAILERDDDRALSLARTIEKLNPSDVNARSERERLEKKVFALKCSHLEEALKSANETAVLNALERVEALNMDDKATASPSVQQGNAIRRTVAARKARGTVADYFAEIPTHVTSGIWQRVGELASRIDRLCVEHNLKLEPDQQQALIDAKVHFTKNQELALRRVQFRDALNALLSHAETVESKTQAHGTVALHDLRDMLTLLNRHWQTVESFTMEVEESVVQRVAKLVEILRSEIARLQKNRLLSVSASILVAAAFLGFAGWYLAGMYRAGEMTKEIEASVQARQIAATTKLIEDADERKLGRFSAGLVTSIENAKAWIKETTQSGKGASAHLTAFEELSQTADFNTLPPADVYGRFQAAKKEIGELPKEQQTDLKIRLDQASGVLQEWLQTKIATSRDALEQHLAAYEKEILPSLGKEQDFVELKKASALASEEIASWDAYLNPGIEDFELPPDLTARAEGQQSKLEAIRKKIASAETALDAMKAVKDLPAFQDAISKLGNADLPAVTDIRKARLAQTLKADPNEMISSLLFPWDPAAWAAFKKGGEAAQLHPASLLPAEDRAYDGLLNDARTTGIFEADIKGRPDRTIYTEKAPLSSDVSGSTHFYSGRIYDPKFDGDVVRFQLRSLSNSENAYDNKEFVTKASHIGPAASAVIYEAMNLSGFISREGNVSLTAWDILDRANGAGRQNTIYQAFVTQALKKMTGIRPYAWGMHLSPSGKAYFETLDKALGGETITSGAWMLPKWKERFAKKEIASLFSKPTHFRNEAVYIQKLAEACANGGLEYAGFVGADGMPVLPSSTAFPESLWGLSAKADEYEPARIFSVQKKNDVPEYTPVAKAVPFTPLFKFVGDRKAAWKRAWETSGLAATPDAKVMTPPLFADLIPKT